MVPSENAERKETHAMNELSIDNLVRVLRECANEDAMVDLEPGVAVEDLPFEKLGLDSLDVCNAAVRIERDFGIGLSYDEVAEAKTPGELLGLVNESIRRGS
jgi:act minimal PKS acyl carrier protein